MTSPDDLKAAMHMLVALQKAADMQQAQLEEIKRVLKALVVGHDVHASASNALIAVTQASVINSAEALEELRAEPAMPAGSQRGHLRLVTDQ